MIEEGFRYFAEMWNPILDVFDECGVRFALEVHPTEIAFDIVTAQRALQALGDRPDVRIQFRPQPSALADRRSRPFPEGVFRPDLSCPHEGRRAAAERPEQHPGARISISAIPTAAGISAPSAAGGVKFEEIIRTLNHIGYRGPLSVEWEDSGMERERGAREALEFVRKIGYRPVRRGLRCGVREKAMTAVGGLVLRLRAGHVFFAVRFDRRQADAEAGHRPGPVRDPHFLLHVHLPRPVAGHRCRHRSRSATSPSPFLGFGAASLCIFLLARSRTYASAVPCCFLLGFGAMALNTAGNTLIPVILFGGKNPAAASNLGNVFFGLGLFLTPLLVSFLFRKTSYEKAVAALGALILIPVVAGDPGRVPESRGRIRLSRGRLPAGRTDRPGRRDRSPSLQQHRDLFLQLADALRQGDVRPGPPGRGTKAPSTPGPRGCSPFSPSP